ncbi:MAG: hypothetical protein IPG96_09115 [Proteobacteria bacterium]|nr:hypothetical protein [Pseudomonadota bacterium]
MQHRRAQHRHDRLQLSRASLVLGTLSLGTLGLLAPGCGSERASELDVIDQHLGAVERDLPGKTGDQLAALCLDYASICERSSGICLGVESSALLKRCDAISARCERNLEGYCSRTPPRRDAGVAGDSSGPRLDGGVAYDGSSSSDGSPRYDGGPMADAALPLPTCRAAITPGFGDARTPFLVHLESDGERCTWAVDYVDQGSIPCDLGTRPFIFPLGLPWVTLYAHGPGGALQCTSAPIEVVAPAAMD